MKISHILNNIDYHTLLVCTRILYINYIALDMNLFLFLPLVMCEVPERAPNEFKKLHACMPRTISWTTEIKRLGHAPSVPTTRPQRCPNVPQTRPKRGPNEPQTKPNLLSLETLLFYGAPNEPQTSRGVAGYLWCTFGISMDIVGATFGARLERICGTFGARNSLSFGAAFGQHMVK